MSEPTEKVPTTPGIEQVIVAEDDPVALVTLELLRTSPSMVPMTRDSWTHPNGVILLSVVVSTNQPYGVTLLRGSALSDAAGDPT